MLVILLSDMDAQTLLSPLHPAVLRAVAQTSHRRQHSVTSSFASLPFCLSFPRRSSRLLSIARSSLMASQTSTANIAPLTPAGGLGACVPLRDTRKKKKRRSLQSINPHLPTVVLFPSNIWTEERCWLPLLFCLLHSQCQSLGKCS